MLVAATLLHLAQKVLRRVDDLIGVIHRSGLFKDFCVSKFDISFRMMFRAKPSDLEGFTVIFVMGLSFLSAFFAWIFD